MVNNNLFVAGWDHKSPFSLEEFALNDSKTVGSGNFAK